MSKSRIQSPECGSQSLQRNEKKLKYANFLTMTTIAKLPLLMYRFRKKKLLNTSMEVLCTIRKKKTTYNNRVLGEKSTNNQAANKSTVPSLNHQGNRGLSKE